MPNPNLVSVQFSGKVYFSDYPITGSTVLKETKTQGVFVKYEDENFLILNCKNNCKNESPLTARSYTLTLVDLEAVAEPVSLTLMPGEIFFSYAEKLLAIKITPSMIETLEKSGVSFDSWDLTHVDSKKDPKKQTVLSIDFKTKQPTQIEVKKESDIESPIQENAIFYQLPLIRVYWDENHDFFNNYGSPLIYKYSDDKKVLAGIFSSYDSEKRKANFIPTKTLMIFLEKIVNAEFRTLDIYRPNTDLSYDGPTLQEVKMWVPYFGLDAITDSFELESLNIKGGLRVTSVFGDAISNPVDFLQPGDVIISINGYPIANRGISLDDQNSLWNNYFSQEQRHSDEFSFLRKGAKETQTLKIERTSFIYDSKTLPTYPGMIMPFVRIGPFVFIETDYIHYRSFRDTSGCSAIKVNYSPNDQALSPKDAMFFENVTKHRILYNRSYLGMPSIIVQSPLFLKKANGSLITQISDLWKLLDSDSETVILTLSRDNLGKEEFTVSIPLSTKAEASSSTLQYSIKVETSPKTSTISMISKIEKTSTSTNESENKREPSEAPEANPPEKQHNLRTQLVAIYAVIYNAENPQTPSTEIIKSAGLLIKNAQGEVAVLAPFPKYSATLNSIEIVTAQQEHFVVLVKRYILSAELAILEIDNQELIKKIKIENPIFAQTPLSPGTSVEILSFRSDLLEKNHSESSQTKAIIKNPAELRTIEQSQLIRLILERTSIEMTGGLVFLTESNTLLGMIDAYDQIQGFATAFESNTLRRTIDEFYQNGFQSDLRHPDIGIVTQPVTDLTTKTLYEGTSGAAIISIHRDLRKKINMQDLLMQVVINGEKYKISSEEHVHSNDRPLPLHWKHFIHMAHMGDRVNLELKNKDGTKKQVTLTLRHTHEDLSPYTRSLPDNPYVFVDGSLFMETPPTSFSQYLPKGSIVIQTEPMRWESIYPDEPTHPSKQVLLIQSSKNHSHHSYRDRRVVSVGETPIQDLRQFYQKLQSTPEEVAIRLCKRSTENPETVVIMLQSSHVKTNLITENVSEVECKAGPGYPQPQPFRNITHKNLPPFSNSVVKLKSFYEDIGNHPWHRNFSSASGSGFFIQHEYEGETEICLVTAMHVLYGLYKTHFPISIEIISTDPSHRFVLDRATLESLPSAVCERPYDVACLVLRGDGIIKRIREFAKPLVLSKSPSAKKNMGVSIVGFNGVGSFSPYDSTLNRVTGQITTIECATKVFKNDSRSLSFPLLAIDIHINPGMSGGVVLKEEDNGTFEVMALVTHVDLGIAGAGNNIVYNTLLPNLLPKVIDSALKGNSIYDQPIFPFTRNTLQKAGTALKPPSIVISIDKILRPSACQQLERGQLWEALIINERPHEITKKGVFVDDWGIHISPESLIIQMCKPGDTVTVVVNDSKVEKEIECELITSTSFLTKWIPGLYSAMSQKQQLWALLSGFLVAEARFQKEENINLADEPTGKTVVVKEVLPLMRGALARNCLWLKGAVVLEICGQPIKEGLSDVKRIYADEKDETIQLNLKSKNGESHMLEIGNAQVNQELAEEQAGILRRTLFFQQNGDRVKSSILDPVTQQLLETDTMPPDAVSSQVAQFSN